MTENIYQRLGLKRVINACGKMTILGVSAVAEEVMQAAARAAGAFVEIDQLVERGGELVSQHTGAQDSYITSCASAGIAIAVAAAVTGGKPWLVARMPDSAGLANEVVMLRGHNVDYGAPITTAIRLGGGRVVEVGQSNLAYRWQLESAVTPQTAALLFVKSHHCVQKGMLTIGDFVEVARLKGIPLIVDAAAEEDLRSWVASGADMVVYSGAKAFNAPTSGFITGRKTWIAACKAQHEGIARAMKIGKENMVGLIAALDRYQQGEDAPGVAVLQPIADAISAIPGFAAEIEQDEAGRAIWRVRVQVLPQRLGLDAREVEALLRQGDIAIYTRRYFLHQGVFSLDPRTVTQAELELIVARLREIAQAQEKTDAVD
ncbi:D-glucosaminate-6-phosphate ammonia lyase [Enterobacillus tribolii]|uniref:D-glucosaminate-6-phosphate ammonia-lyase n=1 Tax=Enterobacillus tribolii TaxID=1487935 RepID=A0A370Q6A6_9GAMM|nr:DgaE family pyridoxal phosphate-dependent ammonia lyase [Enterobacillus tribolii]MBW7984959.1 DgaE family pyridoxal phosphate-dependent ammonia lyase [Enterobacillus tribolii]RDK83901.1 D-glucosaminate-6-phosphate ammonia-lyase [Enterobacillus tribolii]